MNSWSYLFKPQNIPLLHQSSVTVGRRVNFKEEFMNYFHVLRYKSFNFQKFYSYQHFEGKAILLIVKKNKK